MYDVLGRKLSKHDSALDDHHRYLTDDPSPAKFATILRAVDSGDIAALTEIQQEMEAKDALLQGVTKTRRAAITALEWAIEPDPRAKDQRTAKAVAQHVDAQLRSMTNWQTALKFLASGVGPNIAVLELIWRDAMLVDVCPVPGHRLMALSEDTHSVAIETRNEPTGISTKLFRNKFVVHIPEAGPAPLRSTMTHATIWPYIVTHYSRSDWMSFSELYGTPLRYATYDQATIPEDRDTVNELLDNLGTDASASFPEGVQPHLLQSTGNGETYEKQMEWAAKMLQILWLGQTLTTDVGDRGSFAAAKVHDNVRADLLMSDLEAEKRTIQQQIIRPMVNLRFPGKDYPIPVFERQLHERNDMEASRLRLEQLSKAQEMGLSIDHDEAYEALGFTKPQAGDENAIKLGRAELPGVDDEI